MPTEYGEFRITSTPPVWKWSRTGGPLFRVSYQLFGRFEQFCPWDWHVAGFDNHNQAFTVYICPASPIEADSDSPQLVQMRGQLLGLISPMRFGLKP